MACFSKRKKYAVIITGLFLLCALIVFAINYGFSKKAAQTTMQLADDEALKVFFYRMSGTETSGVKNTEKYAVDSDFIIIGKGETWGIIDAGHRYESEIADEDGHEYSVPMLYDKGNGSARVAGLSSQIRGLNGKDAAVFMHEKLGIDHLDFVIATHAHSDHIGGIPDISNYSYVDNGHNYLIDNNTIFFFKGYRHINSSEDDLGADKSDKSYHNQAFFFQAYKAMKNHGAQLIDVSSGGTVHSNKTTYEWNFDTIPDEKRDYSGELNITTERTGLPETNSISFNLGDLRIVLFNLYTHNDAEDENANSIVTIVNANGKNYYFGGDINSENKIEQRIADAIKEKCGTIDLMKLSHHGYNGSNAIDTLDVLRPETIICTRYNGPKWDQEDRINPIIYHSVYEEKYTTGIYETGLADKAIVALGNSESIELYNLKIRNGKYMILEKPDTCANKCMVSDGWYRWDTCLSHGGTPCWYYFKDAKPVTGWLRLNDGNEEKQDSTYYFDSNGVMTIGWKTLHNKTYFFNDGSIGNVEIGCMLTGSHIIKGEKYVFSESGVLIKNGAGGS